MKNILYLDDYINFYSNKIQKVIIEKPYKNTLRNGIVINTDKFIKSFKKLLDKHKIHAGLINEKLVIISTSIYSINDKVNLKSIMESFNYKKIEFISELELLKTDKNKVLINYNFTYYYLYYTDESGNINYSLYKNDNLNRYLLKKIIRLLNKKDIIMYGKNYREIKNILENENVNYYYYEDSKNIAINMLLKKM